MSIPSPTLSGPHRKLEILVVESNPADTILTALAFKAAGLTSGLRSVTDGADALAYVHKEGKYADVSTPDLIFLDLSLPKVSGLEVLKAIELTPHLMHIPIVVASGSENPDHVRAVYALNGNCFMRKPSDLTQFLRFLEMCYLFWGSIVTLSPPKATVGELGPGAGKGPRQCKRCGIAAENGTHPTAAACIDSLRDRLARYE